MDLIGIIIAVLYVSISVFLLKGYEHTIYKKNKKSKIFLVWLWPLLMIISDTYRENFIQVIVSKKVEDIKKLPGKK